MSLITSCNSSLVNMWNIAPGVIVMTSMFISLSFSSITCFSMVNAAFVASFKVIACEKKIRYIYLCIDPVESIGILEVRTKVFYSVLYVRLTQVSHKINVPVLAHVPMVQLNTVLEKIRTVVNIFGKKFSLVRLNIWDDKLSRIFL